MKLWLFTFTDQASQVATAQVAAPGKIDAAEILRERLQSDFEIGLRTRDRVIVAPFGEDCHITAPGILSITTRQAQRITFAQ